jgi:hypothetical protein
MKRQGKTVNSFSLEELTHRNSPKPIFVSLVKGEVLKVFQKQPQIKRLRTFSVLLKGQSYAGIVLAIIGKYLLHPFQHCILFFSKFLHISKTYLFF